MKEKTLFFMEKIQNLQKILLIIMFFAIEFFLTIASYGFLNANCFFINHGLFSGAKYSLQLCCFQF